MIGVSVLMYGLSLNGAINRLEGGLSFALLVLYTVFLIWQSRREQQPRTSLNTKYRLNRNPGLKT